LKQLNSETKNNNNTSCFSCFSSKRPNKNIEKVNIPKTEKIVVAHHKANLSNEVKKGENSFNIISKKWYNKK